MRNAHVVFPNRIIFENPIRLERYRRARSNNIDKVEPWGLVWLEGKEGSLLPYPPCDTLWTVGDDPNRDHVPSLLSNSHLTWESFNPFIYTNDPFVLPLVRKYQYFWPSVMIYTRAISSIKNRNVCQIGAAYAIIRWHFRERLKRESIHIMHTHDSRLGTF